MTGAKRALIETVALEITGEGGAARLEYSRPRPRLLDEVQSVKVRGTRLGQKSPEEVVRADKNAARHA